jgi:hypothetical protein
MNRLGCLRLTERCADILISVRQEIIGAGDVLEQELTDPIRKLEECVLYTTSVRANCSHLIARSFTAVLHFLIKQTSRPFLKRYLKRDEILRDIAACDSSLRDALGLFGVSSRKCLQSLVPIFHYRSRSKSVYLDKFRKRKSVDRLKPKRSSKRSRLAVYHSLSLIQGYRLKAPRRQHLTAINQRPWHIFQRLKMLYTSSRMLQCSHQPYLETFHLHK